MKKLPLLAALLLLTCASGAYAQAISDIAPPGPGEGSPSLSFGDIVAATRGGSPGFGGGTTYGLQVSWGGACAAGSFAYGITPQGAPLCSLSVVSSGPTFTIASGCGAASTPVGGLPTASFTAGQAACAPVLTLPAVSNGWNCTAKDITHPGDIFTQTAISTTGCTLSATVTSGDLVVVTVGGF